MLFKLFLAFAKIGAFSFGGGYAVIPLLYRDTVTINGWLTKSQMTDMVAVAQMTPGPIAVNLATFVGYRLDGIQGAAAATLGLITPSVLLALLVAGFFARFQEKYQVKSVLAGIRPVVIALIAAAAVFLVHGAVKDVFGVMLALLVLFLSAFTRLHPIWMIMIAGFLGMIIY
ncbi:chromate transporter [Metallumcola ferriviriculae]|uniref:Chromate transporter n=1 Tax=Metallumcola ferriviriculae TaxID=3039180 RepID=A0AAU0UIR2_9FIRM|nr:chromate transporter [Desulfitibacteraceae bacterium MK1]